MTDQSPIEDAYYYKLMRRAIDRIDAEGGRELSLEDIARGSADGRG